MNSPFIGPYLKVERAEHHIRELESIFAAALIEGERPRVSHKDVHLVGQAGNFFWQLPKHVVTILGDSVHNLRASLDHAFCILVNANPGNSANRRTQFPFCENREKFYDKHAKEMKKSKSAPSDPALAEIADVIGPYCGTDLYAVHELDIIDKHRGLIPTVATVQMFGSFVNPDGSVILRFDGMKFGGSVNHGTDRFGNERSIGGISFIGGGFNSIKRDDNKSSTIEVRFAQGDPFENQEIIGTLNDLNRLVSNVLKRLEPFAK